MRDSVKVKRYQQAIRYAHTAPLPVLMPRCSSFPSVRQSDRDPRRWGAVRARFPIRITRCFLPCPIESIRDPWRVRVSSRGASLFSSHEVHAYATSLCHEPPIDAHKPYAVNNHGSLAPTSVGTHLPPLTVHQPHALHAYLISHSDIMIRIGIIETVGEPLREPTLRVITRTSFLKLLEPLGALGRVPEPRCSAWGFVGSLFAGSFTITAVLGALGPNQPNGLTKPKKEEASFATCIGAAARSATCGVDAHIYRSKHEEPARRTCCQLLKRPGTRKQDVEIKKTAAISFTSTFGLGDIWSRHSFVKVRSKERSKIRLKGMTHKCFGRTL